MKISLYGVTSKEVIECVEAFKETKPETNSNACCALCGLDMGFPSNGETYYCFNEKTCG